MNIFYKSWSDTESTIELNKIDSLEKNNQWIDANKDYSKIKSNDVWLTTNGNDYIPHASFKQVSWHAESYTYNKANWDIFSKDKRFQLRFHFNSNLCNDDNVQQLPIYTWWDKEFELFKNTVNNKKPEHTFGMVLGYKPENRKDFDKSYFGWFRAKVVQASENRSFKYYGTNWNPQNKNYGGEAYIAGHRGDPEKFHDARKLMTKSKFVWALENTHDNYYSNNYMTEKIFHGFISASVPIYCGCNNISDLIPSDIFIDVRKFAYNIDEVMNFCEKMSDIEYQGYLSRIGEFLEKKGQEFKGETIFKKVDEKIYKYFK